MLVGGIGDRCGGGGGLLETAPTDDQHRLVRESTQSREHHYRVFLQAIHARARDHVPHQGIILEALRGARTSPTPPAAAARRSSVGGARCSAWGHERRS